MRQHHQLLSTPQHGLTRFGVSEATARGVNAVNHFLVVAQEVPPPPSSLKKSTLLLTRFFTKRRMGTRDRMTRVVAASS
jgi:hypothetical protein